MVSINRNDYLMEYSMFVYDQAYEQFKFNASLSSVLSEAEISQETKDKVANGFEAFTNKLIDSVTNVVTKFLTALREFVTGNREYLKTYKDIILNKKPLKAKISGFYDYDTKKLMEVQMPEYTVDELLKLPKEKDE